MFNQEMLLKLMGVSGESFNQLMAVKFYLDKLPLKKQQEIVGNFVKELKDAVENTEKGDKKNEEADKSKES